MNGRIEDWREAESSWVLDHGLPTDLPAAVSELLVPVAFWVGVDFGAVMSLQWSDDVSDPDRYVSTEIEVYRRSQAGWDATGAGGSSWPDSRLMPLPIGARACSFHHVHGEGRQHSMVVTVDGVAGAEAATVEVLDRHGSIRHPLNSQVGAVIAPAEPRPEATVTVFDGAGRTLDGVPVNWDCNMRPTEK